MAEQDVDRSEAATPTKLKKAREQGQTARSTDAVAAVVFAAAMAYVAWQGADATAALLRACRAALAQAMGMAWTSDAVLSLVGRLLAEAGALLLPFLLLPMAAALAGTWAHTGFVLALDPVKIDFARLNPAAGFKRMFSLRALFDTARAGVKLLLLMLAAWWAWRALLPQFYQLAALTPGAFLRTLIAATGALGLKMAVALLLVAALDLAYTRAEFGRRMRMSRRDLKDEFRNREGDPRIRSRLRELRREMLRRSQALRNTRTADVVLTNPTHYAVALRYVHGEMAAPQLVAKGAGQLAAAMREIAYRHRVTVVQNPPLARRLFREMQIDQLVPPAFHAEVARIVVWVFAMREQRRAAAGGAA